MIGGETYRSGEASIHSATQLHVLPAIQVAMPRTGVDWPLVLMALFSLPWVALWLLPPVNLDVAALLQFTERWLTGEQLYVELVDVNPPLVFLLYAAPILLARWGGFGAIAAFNLSLLLFAMLVGRMAWRRMLLLGPPPAQKLAMAGLLPFAVAALSTLMAGQREHLLALALLPWLFDAGLRAIAPRPWRRSLPAALLAVIGLCLKPHFVMIAVLVEAWLALRRWPWPWADPVPWVMAGVMLLYGGFVALVFPAYLSAILPLALGSYAAFNDMSPGAVLLQDFFRPALVLLLLCLPFAARLGGSMGVALALAACGAVLGAMAQGKGWPYHYLPAEMLIVLLAAWLLGAVWARSGRPASLALAMGVMVLINAIAVTTRVGPWTDWTGRDRPLELLASEMRLRAPRQPVLVLSPMIGPIFPAMVEAGTTQAMRFMSLWMLEAAYAQCPASGRRYREPGEMSADERYVFDAVAHDFAQRRPRLVVFDLEHGIPTCGGTFEFEAYFSRNPQFAATLAQYRPVRDDGRFRFFTRVD